MNETSPPPLLAVTGLTMRYRIAGGSVAALSDVDLDVARGRTLAIVGESGSGKSTVALALMGLLPAEAEVTGGRVLYDGVDLLKLGREQRRAIRGGRMALVFQDPFSVLNPSMRVGEQIGEGLVYHRGATRQAALARAIELLAEVGIPDPKSIAAAYPHELSGGMRQRALIAGALAAEPDLLILDEPTTALDVTVEAQILDLLRDLQAKRGLSMLFITHNLGVVRQIADEVAVMYAGEIVERGAAAAVFAAPRHPYTKGLLAAIPRLTAHQQRLAAIPGRLPDLRSPPPGCRFMPRCPFAQSECAAPQPLIITAGRQVRCVRADAVRDAPWRAAAEAAGDAAPTTRPEQEPAPVVEVTDLRKTFRLTRGLGAVKLEGWRPVARRITVNAIDGVSLTVDRGEIVGLVGESGCGKTTLGRTILRLVDADSGQIRIAGSEVSSRPQSQLTDMRARAQIVFQNPDSSLNPRKTIGDIIARSLIRFGIVAPGDVTARVAALLDRVRLPTHYAGRYPHQLSGGEKQRVGIARAIATEPQFIVCDEPVSALDVSVQAAIVNLLRDLRDRLDVAYLFISHDISVVAHLADRIAVMYRGRIVEVGETAEVLAPPMHPYTEALLSAVPSVETRDRHRIRLPLEPRRSVTTAGCVFAGRCPRRLGEICDTTSPPVVTRSASHRIACHLDFGAAPSGLSK